ncbi:hypothetical protein SAY87_010190 [Trapa incisa]|uniref:Pectinesterase inhibitor domain-containing protein n=1 Tax=Trapa incisa TaxID=236973 RepID=A0AAN7GGR5_9MYRT|nr:hypothetical protein SAY87_010190 [Trapa incisa]
MRWQVFLLYFIIKLQSHYLLSGPVLVRGITPFSPSLDAMAKAEHALFAILLLFSPESILAADASATASWVTGRRPLIPTPTDVSFIKSSCLTTRYPALCVHYLSRYAAFIRGSDRDLAQVALNVSLSRSRSAASFVSRLFRARDLSPWDHRAVRDCVENMEDTVDRLAQSVREIARAGWGASVDFEWHLSNVQTWVSAALTDENTCTDGFTRQSPGDLMVKVAVRRRVVDVAQVTSNALALVNRFASRHRSAGGDP